MRTCEYSNIRICEYPNMRMCEYPNMRICESAGNFSHIKLRTCSTFEMCRPNTNALYARDDLSECLILFSVVFSIIRMNKKYQWNCIMGKTNVQPRVVIVT